MTLTDGYRSRDLNADNNNHLKNKYLVFYIWKIKMLREVMEGLKFLVRRKEKAIRLSIC